ncbi:hypothetical protein K438DRAFT_1746968 [Mycena galopus ATCC 62051]|nr:hypothetical protein K438DRAFT_1746968 [Mycena galopus ATCC 62051]
MTLKDEASKSEEPKFPARNFGYEARLPYLEVPKSLCELFELLAIQHQYTRRWNSIKNFKLWPCAFPRPGHRQYTISLARLSRQRPQLLTNSERLLAGENRSECAVGGRSTRVGVRKFERVSHTARRMGTALQGQNPQSTDANHSEHDHEARGRVTGVRTLQQRDGLHYDVGVYAACGAKCRSREAGRATDGAVDVEDAATGKNSKWVTRACGRKHGRRRGGRLWPEHNERVDALGMWRIPSSFPRGKLRSGQTVWTDTPAYKWSCSARHEALGGSATAIEVSRQQRQRVAMLDQGVWRASLDELARIRRQRHGMPPGPIPGLPSRSGVGRCAPCCSYCTMVGVRLTVVAVRAWTTALGADGVFDVDIEECGDVQSRGEGTSALAVTIDSKRRVRKTTERPYSLTRQHVHSARARRERAESARAWTVSRTVTAAQSAAPIKEVPRRPLSAQSHRAQTALRIEVTSGALFSTRECVRSARSMGAKQRVMSSRDGSCPGRSCSVWCAFPQRERGMAPEESSSGAGVAESSLDESMCSVEDKGTATRGYQGCVLAPLSGLARVPALTGHERGGRYRQPQRGHGRPQCRCGSRSGPQPSSAGVRCNASCLVGSGVRHALTRREHGNMRAWPKHRDHTQLAGEAVARVRKARSRTARCTEGGGVTVKNAPRGKPPCRGRGFARGTAAALTRVVFGPWTKCRPSSLTVEGYRNFVPACKLTAPVKPLRAGRRPDGCARREVVDAGASLTKRSRQRCRLRQQLVSNSTSPIRTVAKGKNGEVPAIYQHWNCSCREEPLFIARLYRFQLIASGHKAGDQAEVSGSRRQKEVATSSMTAWDRGGAKVHSESRKRAQAGRRRTVRAASTDEVCVVGQQHATQMRSLSKMHGATCVCCPVCPPKPQSEAKARQASRAARHGSHSRNCDHPLFVGTAVAATGVVSRYADSTVDGGTSRYSGGHAGTDEAEDKMEADRAPAYKGSTPSPRNEEGDGDKQRGELTSPDATSSNVPDQARGVRTSASAFSGQRTMNWQLAENHRKPSAEVPRFSKFRAHDCRGIITVGEPGAGGLLDAGGELRGRCRMASQLQNLLEETVARNIHRKYGGERAQILAYRA